MAIHSYETTVRSLWSGTARYEPLALLGRGGVGVVLRALDRRTGERVAIKLLRSNHGGSLRRFRAEFESVAAIAHRNLVSLYELDARESRWFIVMQEIDGAHLLETSDSASGTRARLTLDAIDEGGVRAITSEHAAFPRHDRRAVRALCERFVQLCDGLEALHERDALHLDLKPGNVLVERGTGRVVIVDLGLSHSHNDATFSLAGTPAYLSPELLEHQRPTSAADRYAVGVMLFEAFAQRWPFGGSTSQILTSKRCDVAPTLRSVLGATVPGALDDLCAALLSRAPDARPSLDEARSILRALCDESPAQSSAPSIDSRPRSPETPRSWSGVLSAILQPVDGACARVSLLTGPVGSGRSTLLSTARGALEQRGDAVISARCDRSARVRYALLETLSRRCLRRGEHSAGQDAIDALVSCAQPSGDTLESAIDAIASRLTALCEQRTVTIVIDDAHEADEESLAALATLTLRIRAKTQWIIAARDGDELDALRLALASAPAVRVDELRMPSIDDADAARIVRSLAPSLEASAVDEVVSAASGSAWALDTIARACESSGAVQSLDGAIRVAFDALSAADRELLALLAAARGPLETSVIAAALSKPGLMRGSERTLRLRGLVVRRPCEDDEEGALDLAHPALERALLARREARWVERRLLRALDVTCAVSEASARICAAHGREDEAKQRWIALAERSASRGEFALATRRYERALSFAVAPRELASLHSAIATNLAASGRASDAGDAFERAASLSSQAARDGLYVRAAEQWLHCGRYSDGRAALRRARDERDPRSPQADARALEAGLVLVSGVGLVDPPAILLTHRQNSALAERLGDDRARLRVAAMDLMVDGAIGALRDEHAARTLIEIERVTARLVSTDASERERRAARAMIEHAHGVHAVQRGRYREGVARIERGESHFLASDPWSWERTVAAHFRHWGLYYLGEFGRLARSAPTLAARAHRSRDRFATLDFRTQHSVCAWLLADDATRAEAQLDHALTQLSLDRSKMQEHDVNVAKVELSLYRGDTRAAFDRCRDAFGWSPLTSVLAPEGIRIDTHALRARAALAAIAAGHDTIVARASVEAAIAALSIERAPWSRALAAYFRASATSGARARARWVHAHALLEEQGLGAYARCASDAIARIEGRTQSSATSFFAEQGARNPRAFLRIFASERAEQ